MASLAVAQTLPELKQLYRRLAALHHPDKGGCSHKMQILNKQYRIMQKRLKDSANDADISTDDFSNLQIGTKLFINRTPVEVLWVNEHSFRVVAEGRSRQAQFDKRTGLGRFNSRLKASFTRQNPTH